MAMFRFAVPRPPPPPPPPPPNPPPPNAPRPPPCCPCRWVGVPKERTMRTLTSSRSLIDVVTR
ncbi:MAG: hypothetical protein DMF90_03795 [Acidobacteria bacterium]|nr:MAG: hypothetical protein DMF90_03795 [Acidobacteriota bacterium]